MRLRNVVLTDGGPLQEYGAKEEADDGKEKKEHVTISEVAETAIAPANIKDRPSLTVAPGGINVRNVHSEY